MKYKLISFCLLLTICLAVYGCFFHKGQTPEEYQKQVILAQNAEMLTFLPPGSKVVENLGKDWFLIDTACKQFNMPLLCKINRNGSVIIITFSRSPLFEKVTDIKFKNLKGKE